MTLPWKTADAIRYLKGQLGHAIIGEIEFRGETTLEVDKEHLKQVLALLKESPCPGYKVLMDLTAVDYLVPTPRTKVVYWLHHPLTYERLRITVFIARGESIPTVTDLWAGADWYERELFDLFGITFDHHPNLQRILMPDNWIGHPLCRDYALTEEPVAFKHGVTPKVPSEIIPHVKEPRTS
jgi:NADH-quinone oxidoreductase subunit C